MTGCRTAHRKRGRYVQAIPNRSRYVRKKERILEDEKITRSIKFRTNPLSQLVIGELETVTIEQRSLDRSRFELTKYMQERLNLKE